MIYIFIRLPTVASDDATLDTQIPEPYYLEEETMEEVQADQPDDSLDYSTDNIVSPYRPRTESLHDLFGLDSHFGFFWFLYFDQAQFQCGILIVINTFDKCLKLEL